MIYERSLLIIKKNKVNYSNKEKLLKIILLICLLCGDIVYLLLRLFLN